MSFSNTTVTWQLYRFSELDPATLYALLRLRQDVFVIEQKCLYPDLDNNDQKAWHMCAMNNSELLAYSRLLPPGLKYTEPSIGRVVVAERYRSSGLGYALVERSIAELVKRHSGVGIRLSAQQHLESFYQSLGFKRVSAPYDEDGIPHIEMLRVC